MSDVTLRWLLAAVLLAYILGAIGYSVIWRLFLKRGPAQPTPPRYPMAPWSGSEVALALFMFDAVPRVIGALLRGVGALPAHDPRVPPQNHVPTQSELLVKALFIGPLQVAAMLTVLWLGSRTRPKRVGLRLYRWSRSLYLAVATYLIVTPIVFGINVIATYLMRSAGVPDSEHPLMRLAKKDPRASTLAIVVVTVVVLAPLIEELLFRGIMMPWLARRWWGGWAAMAGAIAMGLAALPEKAPLAFALVFGLIGIAITFPHIGEQWTRRSIIGTALLFAMFHYMVWPSPIPLFFLGIALGWLAHRSRGLLAPILLHSLFNATSTVLLMAPLLKSPPEITPPDEGPPVPRPAQIRSAPPPPSPGPGGRGAGMPGR